MDPALSEHQSPYVRACVYPSTIGTEVGSDVGADTIAFSDALSNPWYDRSNGE
jgi:hypothetical protein